MWQSSLKMSFKTIFRCQNSFLCLTDQGTIPVPSSGAKSEMLKQSQNAPYQNWQVKERGNFSKCENIPSEHTASNYFWSHSNAEGGSRRNSNCVSSVGSRKLQIAEHTMFQFQRSCFLTGRAGAWKHGAGTTAGQCCALHWEVTSCAGCSRTESGPRCCNCAIGHTRHEGNAQLFLILSCSSRVRLCGCFYIPIE